MNKIRILISRPDRVGDVILSTPIPREIKKKYPDSFVAVLLRSYTKDVYLNNPFVDEIIIDDYDKDKSLSGFVNQVNRLRKLKFTHSLMLIPTERMNWMLFFAGIKCRIGVGYKFYQFLTNTKSIFRNKYIPLRHEADYCADAIRKIGIDTDNLGAEIHLTEIEKKKVIELKNEIAPNGEKVIGIHSTYGNSSPNWKPEMYRKLIDDIKDNYKIIITDAVPPKELNNLAEVNYPDVSTLRKLFVTLKVCDLFISSSTGPMHAAGALNVKTLSLFCPLPACSPSLWGPKGNESHFILPEVEYCSNLCSGNPSNCYFEGEKGIVTDNVAKKIFDLI